MSALALPVSGAGGRSGAARTPLLREQPAFAALALLAALRWNTLLSPGAGWRLAGMVALAVTLSAAGTLLRRRWLLPATLLAVAALPILSGWRASWVLHLRLAVLGRAIGSGAGALPRTLVPYNGINPDIRATILASAGLLLILGALLPALVGRSRPLAARGVGAVPLLFAAVLPVTLVRPGLPEAEGLLLLVLLVGYVAGPSGRAVGRGLMLVAAAGVAAIPLAGALRPAHPWLNPSTLAGGLGSGDAARFDWRQTYGPLNWPRAGRLVLSVAAAAPAYWKAENLDAFNGRGWSAASDTQPAQPPIARWALRRFTQTLTVTDDGVSSQQLVTAGEAEQPAALGGVTPGASAGTWSRPAGLNPGDSYRVRAYTPRPTPAELGRARSEPAALAAFRTVQIPSGALPGRPTFSVTFSPFGQGAPGVSAPGLAPGVARSAIEFSPYGGVYELARRLARGAHTPRAVVAAVLHHLAHGYRYDENPPAAPLPLVSFLLLSRRGYCQHFAGAMALLLRMDGIPARVSTGFTRGTYDTATGEWDVQDVDAHAWVEAWFPALGWVTFDPTPGVAPELADVASSTPASYRPARIITGDHGLGSAPSHTASPAGHGRRAANPGRPGGNPLPWVLLALALMSAAAAARSVRLRPPGPEALLAELERALARCGRPLPAGATLAGLERRLRDDPEAQAYVRKLREVRYAPAESFRAPTRRERAALRRVLRQGSGRGERARGIWALPPLFVLLH